jgi:hypothetical protein
MVYLPPPEEIKKLIQEKKGLSELQIAEGVQKIKEKYKGIVKSDSLALFMFARSLGLEITPIVPPAGAMIDSIKAIYDGRAPEVFSICGFLGDIGQAIAKGRRVVTFWLVDKTGCIAGRAYDNLESWNGLAWGDWVRIDNARAWKVPDGRIILTLHDDSRIAKDTPPEGLSLSKLVRNALEVVPQDREYMQVAGVVLGISKQTYQACATCFAKVDGNKCEKCGGTTVGEASFTRLTVGDGVNQMTCAFPPRFGDIQIPLGSVVTVYGVYDASRKELSASHIEVQEEVKYEEYFEEPEKEEVKEEVAVIPTPIPVEEVKEEKAEKPKEELDEYSKVILRLVKEYQVMPETACIKYLIFRYDLPEEKCKEILNKLIEMGYLVSDKGKVRIAK